MIYHLEAVLTEDELIELRAIAARVRWDDGRKTAGPIAELSLGQRWHWLTAPANTVVQPGPVHTGFTADPAATLDRLFQRLVLGTSE